MNSLISVPCVCVKGGTSSPPKWTVTRAWLIRLLAHMLFQLYILYIYISKATVFMTSIERQRMQNVT